MVRLVFLAAILCVVNAVPSGADDGDTWVPTETLGAPTARGHHSAVWTGSEMVVWGGSGAGSVTFDTGGIFDPLAGTWIAISAVGAPTPRVDQTTVWTGSEMIVWGGGAVETDTGGRYDPVADAWTAITNAGAPSARYHHSAVWTGSEMIIWGGWSSPAYVQDGARYNPADDTWTPISTDGAPSARGRHSAVWTGSEMIVWGGYSTDGVGGDAYHANGARYDPATDSWTAMVASGPPTARREHSAVWTGQEMIVWGGYDGSDNPVSGGRYDPVAGSWRSTRTSGAPSGRQDHVALWTGSEMIIWGGFIEPSTYCSTGARYRPVADRWLATSSTDAPVRRRWHSGVWTGDEMIVWGGRFQDYSSGEWLDDGGVYSPGDWAPVARFPFHEDFESAGMPDQWEVSTVGGGVVNLRPDHPYAGFSAAELDERSGYLTSKADLILHIDLSGQDDVVLDFWWYELGDDWYLYDGVYVSDDYGETWLQVMSFTGGISSYQNEIIDLDAVADANMLDLNDHFQIRFAFFDNNYSSVYDGYVLDEVSVRTGVLPILTVELDGTGSGSVSSDPAGISCPGDCSEGFTHFTVVSLSATPDWPSDFVGWGGDPDCDDGEVTLVGDTTCVAVFDISESLIFADGFEVGDTSNWPVIR